MSRLQLNPSKTELIWFGSRVSLRKIAVFDLSLRVGNDVVTPVDAARPRCHTDSRVDNAATVNKFTSACFFHVRRLKQTTVMQHLPVYMESNRKFKRKTN